MPRVFKRFSVRKREVKHLLGEISLTDTFLTIFLDETLYYWRVKSIDIAGNESDWSNIWWFEVDTTKPGKPFLSAPDSGAYTKDTVVLQWSTVLFSSSKPKFELPRVRTHKFNDKLNIRKNSNGVTNPIRDYELTSAPVRYVVQVDTSILFTSPLVWDTVSTTYDSVILQKEREYYWRVKSFDLASNEGNWSNIWLFTVDTTKPNIAVLLQPDSGAYIDTLNVTFIWHQAVDNMSVAYYLLESAYDEGFTISVGTVSVVDTFVEIVLDETLYYWHVKAVDSAGNKSDWSNTRYFEIDTTIPVKPVLTAPKNDTWLNDTVVVFSWSPVKSVSYTHLTLPTKA